MNTPLKACYIQHLTVNITWQSIEVINKVHVFAVGVRGNEVEFLQELHLRSIRRIDNPQGVHLNVCRVSFPHSDAKFDRLSFVSLTVGDNDGYFPDSRPSAEESLPSRLSDGGAGVGALTHVRHFPDCLLDVLFAHVANQVELQMDIQTVEDQSNSGGVASNCGPVDQPGDKVLDDFKVLGADALWAVDDEHKFHRPFFALDAASWEKGNAFTSCAAIVTALKRNVRIWTTTKTFNSFPTFF